MYGGGSALHFMQLHPNAMPLPGLADLSFYAGTDRYYMVVNTDAAGHLVNVGFISKECSASVKLALT